MATDPRHFDVIVAGVGGMGSATVYHLARRGMRVLGLERFDIPNAMGSSHGMTRIIRLAYFEHAAYVPLLHRAYELWRALQAESGEQLLHVTGSDDAGLPDSAVFKGSARSCDTHQLNHEILSSTELSERFPAYQLPSSFQAVFQPDGGFVLPERCIVGHVNRAQELGAEVHGRERMLMWEALGDDAVRVTTDRATYEAGRLVIAAGAWAREYVHELEGHAIPERQVLGWFHPLAPELFHPGRFPVFNIRVDEGHFYGFPVFGIPGFKIGRYHHHEEHVDPDAMEREPQPRDEQTLREAVSKYFPQANGPTLSLVTCLFTNTPDEHFVLDRLPAHPQVSVAAGFSGHGFKFASVVGEIMADLAEKGHTSHDIARFSLSRF